MFGLALIMITCVLLSSYQSSVETKGKDRGLLKVANYPAPVRSVWRAGSMCQWEGYHLKPISWEGDLRQMQEKPVKWGEGEGGGGLHIFLLNMREMSTLPEGMVQDMLLPPSFGSFTNGGKYRGGR